MDVLTLDDLSFPAAPDVLSPEEAVQSHKTAWAKTGFERARATVPKQQTKFDYTMERLPVAGGFYSGAKAIDLTKSVKAIQNGTADQQDFNFVQHSLNRRQEESEKSWLARTGDIITSLPGFATEFAMTGGSFSGARKAAQGVATRVLGKAAEEGAVGLASKAAVNLAGSAAQTLAMPQNIGKNTLERMAPQVSSEAAQVGDVSHLVSKEGDGFAEALAKGFGDTLIENTSERMGGFLEKATGITALKSVIAKRFMLKTGANASTFGKILKTAGWDGVIGEVLEERAGEVARGATGISSNYGVTGNLLAGDRAAALSQLASEAVAFSVPGAANVAINAPGAISQKLIQLKEIRAKGWVSAEDAQLAGTGGATRKERLANLDSAIKQEEIQNASTVRSPEAEIRQPESSQDLRGQGQVEVPEKPAAEVASQGSQVQVENHLDKWLATQPKGMDAVIQTNADKMIKNGEYSSFAPENWSSDQKTLAKRDAYIEAIRQKGYDVTNIRYEDNSGVLHGDIVPLAKQPKAQPQAPVDQDAMAAILAAEKAAPEAAKPPETMSGQDILQAQVEAAQKPVPAPTKKNMGRKPVIPPKSKEEADQFIRDIINRGPSEKGPKALAEWTQKGFGQEHYSAAIPEGKTLEDVLSEHPMMGGKPQEATSKPPESLPAAPKPVPTKKDMGRKQPADGAEPPVKPGFVRVYHSGGEKNEGGPRWVSTDRTYASNYRPDLPLHFMDLPANDPRVNNPDYPEQGVKQGFTFNFELPSSEAKQLTQVARPAEPSQKPPESPPAAPKPELAPEPTPAVPVTPAASQEAEKPVKRSYKKEPIPAPETAPVEQPPKKGTKAYFKAYSAEVGQYRLGPVETETGTKFGVFAKSDERGGPVATFDGRDSAVQFMETQKKADEPVQPKEPVTKAEPIPAPVEEKKAAEAIPAGMTEDEFAIQNKIQSAPSYPKLVERYRSHLKSLGYSDEDVQKRIQEKSPESLLSSHAGVMNAKSQRAKTMKSLADAVIKESGVPMRPPGKFRGENYRVDWEKAIPTKTSLQQSADKATQEPGFGKEASQGPGIASAVPILGNPSEALKSVQHFFQRFFTSRGELPAEVYEAKTRKEGRVAKEMSQLRFAARDFRVGIKKALGGKELTQAGVEQMNSVLRGEADLSSVPAEVRAPLLAMRDHIDAISRKLISEGVAQGDLAGIITENLGIYATRSYRVFDDPKWRDKVPDGVRNQAISAIRDMYPDKSDAEVQGMLESLLFRGAADSPVALLKGSKLGSKDLSTFMKRQDVPEWLRDLWGEYKDAGVNYARSVFKMSNLLASHQFLNEVKQAGLGKWLSEEPIVGEYGNVAAKLAADSSSVMEPLNGLYTTPEIKAAFERMDSPGNMPQWLRVMMSVNYAVKYGKTIGSLMTHIRNTVSNLGFAVANGHWRLDKAGKALWGTATGTFQLPDAEFRKYYKRMAELGIVGEDTRAGELKDALRDASQVNIDEFIYNREARHAKKLVNAGRTALRFADSLYQAEDGVWKIYAFENEKARYAEVHPDWSQDRLEKYAAEIVRNTYPTYSKIPEGIKALRRFPVVGTFVSFPSEVIRTTFHTIKLGVEEMKSPETRSIGAQRLAGTALAIGGLSILTRAMMALLGIGDDEDDDLRWFVAPWQENSNFLYTSKPTDATYQFVDLSYSDPHAYLTDSVTAFLRGEDWRDSLGKSVAELAGPFASEEILAKALLDLRSNQDHKIYNPKDEVGQQAKDIAAHMWNKALEPGTVTSLRRLADPSKDTATEATALVTGQRLQKVDVANSLGFRVRDFAKALTDIQAIARKTAISRGTATGAMVATDVARMEKLRLAEFAQMQKIVGAARRLGVPEENIRTLLRGELADKVAGEILTGDYSPYEMSPQTMRQMLKASPKEFKERFGGWHGDKLPEAITDLATSKIGNLPTNPKSKDYEETVRETKETLDSLGVTLEEARAMLKDYYRKPDSTGKRGSLVDKQTGKVKESYLQKMSVLNNLYK